jgi:hypothetical protein
LRVIGFDVISVQSTIPRTWLMPGNIFLNDVDEHRVMKDKEVILARV